MPTIYDWSTTASDNSFVGAISIAEGMSPAHVNDGMRTMMAHVAALVEDRGGATATTNSGNAYAASSAGIEALATGLRLTIRVNAGNTGAATLNVNALGARDIKVLTPAGEADVGTGALAAGGRYDLVYDAAADSAAGAWLLVGASPLSALTPTDNGVVIGNGTSFVVESGATARTSLGVPGLADANQFGAVQTIAISAAQTDLLVLRNSNNGNLEGPLLTLDRNSASPEASDALGVLNFAGRDSGGASLAYASIRAVLLDPTDGSEDGALDFHSVVAGTSAARIRVGQGLHTSGVPDMGANTINATTLYEGGTGLAAKYGALSGGNSWSGTQTATLATAGANLAAITTDAGSTGAIVEMWHNSPSPANNDVVGILRFRGNDGGGGANEYVQMYGQIVDSTAGSEDGRWVLQIMTAGSLTNSVLATGGTFEVNATTLDVNAAMDVAGNLMPSNSDNYDIGSYSKMWSNMFLSDGLFIGKSANDLAVTGVQTLASGHGIGITSSGASSVGFILNCQDANSAVASFRRSNTQVGTITVNTTNTAYNTSSDEELKQFTGLLNPAVAADIIRRDPAREWVWRSTGARGRGWGAQTSHKVSEDLAWTDGDGVARSMDLSKRTPYLWAATSWLLDRYEEIFSRLKAVEKT